MNRRTWNERPGIQLYMDIECILHYYIRNIIFNLIITKFVCLRSGTQVVSMLACLIDTFCIDFGVSVFKQTVGILIMGTNCAPLLSDVFLNLYGTEVSQQHIKGENEYLVKHHISQSGILMMCLTLRIHNFLITVTSFICLNFGNTTDSCLILQATNFT